MEDHELREYDHGPEGAAWKFYKRACDTSVVVAASVIEGGTYF